jgi:hypothetical protein
MAIRNVYNEVSELMTILSQVTYFEDFCVLHFLQTVDDLNYHLGIKSEWLFSHFRNSNSYVDLQVSLPYSPE